MAKIADMTDDEIQNEIQVREQKRRSAELRATLRRLREEDRELL